MQHRAQHSATKEPTRPCKSMRSPPRPSALRATKLRTHACMCAPTHTCSCVSHAARGSVSKLQPHKAARTQGIPHKASGTSFVRSSHVAYQDAFNRRTCAVTASMLTSTVIAAAAASARHSGGRSGSLDLVQGRHLRSGGVPRPTCARPMAFRRMAGRPSAQAAHGERPRSSAPAHTAAPCGGTPG